MAPPYTYTHTHTPSSVDSTSSVSRELLRLMKVPVLSYEDPLTILKLPHFSPVYSLFDYNGRKSLATYLVQTIVEKEAKISTADEVIMT